MFKGEVMKLGLLFTGFGEQFVTMGKDVYDVTRSTQELFDQASIVTQVNYIKLIFADSDAELAKIENGYGALYLVQAALYEILKEKGICPEFIAGYGIGEYTAMHAAGGLTFVDGLYLLQKYATLIQQAQEELSQYSILHIPRSISAEELENLFPQLKVKENSLFISAFNMPEDHFISGTHKSIDVLEDMCDKMEIKKMKRFGFEMELRTPWMQVVVDQFKIYFHKVTFHDLQVPVITNVDGAYITTAHAVEGAMLRRPVEPIHWYETMQGFAGCDTLLIIGPGERLVKWAQSLYPDKKIMQILTLQDIAQVVALLPENSEQCGPVVQEGATLHDLDEQNEIEDEDDDFVDEASDEDVEVE
ncbi:acyltransferase domain-containing protein [bacterium]|nr:acyltransferase domain-containing protein [bacterium]NBX78307.1 acyltransferase domain-containing protein [bacterium]